jgi:hypothetical protein
MTILGLESVGTKKEQLVIDIWGTHPTRSIDGNACITGFLEDFQGIGYVPEMHIQEVHPLSTEL